MTKSFAKPLPLAARIAALFAALLVLLLAVPATAQSGEDDLGRVSRHLRAISSMTADFSQTDRTGQTVGGKLMLKQPGKIRFQYQKDVPLLIVADGRALTMIDYEVNQVQRWPIRNSPLGALLDPQRDLTKYGRVLKTTDKDILSVEVKDAKHPEYGVITLIFERKASAPAGLEMLGWVALDSQNKRTSIRLANHRYNVPIASSAFDWVDPRKKRR